MRRLLPDETISLVRDGQFVEDAQVSDGIDFEVLQTADPDTHFSVRQALRFRRCILSRLVVEPMVFRGLVEFVDCVIEVAAFPATYFIGGLNVVRCDIRSEVDFQSGGHNSRNAPFRVLETTFAGFVNFFDCWFQGPVEIRGCTFGQGTNLLGNMGRPYAARFDVSPVVVGNHGAMNLDGERAT